MNTLEHIVASLGAKVKRIRTMPLAEADVALKTLEFDLFALGTEIHNLEIGDPHTPQMLSISLRLGKEVTTS